MTPKAAKHQRIDMMSMLILGVCALWAGYWFVHAQDYWEDDAYIHLEYARNLFGGKGFMFNGLVSNGDTSPVWVLLLGLSHMVWPDWLGSGKALTVASTAFAASMVYLYAQRLARALGAEPGRVPATMVALFVFNPYFCYWAFSGMEAVLAAGLLLLIVMLLTPERPGRTSFFSAAFLLGLAPLVRPEMILLLVVASPFLLWQWVQLTHSMSARHKLAHFALAAVLLALPLLIWSIYALQAFGYVLPNTNAAKRASPDSSVVMRLLSVYGMGFPGVLISLLARPLPRFDLALADLGCGHHRLLCGEPHLCANALCHGAGTSADVDTAVGAHEGGSPRTGPGRGRRGTELGLDLQLAADTPIHSKQG